MEYRELGATGVMIPEVGLGTWKYRGGPEPLRRGIELGANLIDTSEMYRTEDAVGQAIRGIRDRVFVATKVLGSNLRYDDVLRAAEKSLRLLDDPIIDLYQIHWPSRSVPISETMRAMSFSYLMPAASADPLAASTTPATASPGARWARPSSAGTRRGNTRWNGPSSTARSPPTS